MARVTVIRPFHDLVEDVDRRAGDVFDATDERARQLACVLPRGYVEVEQPQIAEPEEKPADDMPDLLSMTVAQLKALASERGTEIPKGARKADIIKLLKG